MIKLKITTLLLLIAFLLSGCYTGKTELNPAYIRNYKLTSYEKEGQTHIKITGQCGLPMGVVSVERHLNGTTVILKIIVDEKLIKERNINEEFPISNSVTELKMGDDILWRRAKPKEKAENLNWDL